MHFIDFSKKNIILTGASSGIGEATALLLDKLGATLVLVGRNAKALHALNRGLQGKQHIILERDLTHWIDIQKDFKELYQKNGTLDGLVHCAGLHLLKPFKLLNDKNIADIFDINVKSAFHLIQAFRQRGYCSKSASIVLLSSVVSQVGQVGASLYAASKGSLESLAKSLALELAPENIRVNCISPGIVNTKMTASLFEKLNPEQIEKIKNMHPLGLGESEDVANGIAFLLSQRSRWITGTSLVIDGGYLAH
ncbi:MAG: SDR family oxidoreductase [Pseudomonadota bacterium]